MLYNRLLDCCEDNMVWLCCITGCWIVVKIDMVWLCCITGCWIVVKIDKVWLCCVAGCSYILPHMIDDI